MINHNFFVYSIECMTTTRNGGGNSGQIIICGTQLGHLVFRDSATLQEYHRMTSLDIHGGIRYLGFEESEQYLLIGCRDGSYSIATDPEHRLRLYSSAIQKTPMLS
jgi:hypothetical protein